eukprot:TRINITY_DN7306_c0_g1_i10.p1 TRINITY_DN7306_c0_g1~~TRINITY_DN7306_c0_g1_i10.p1  ORF type:complete len:1395 (-),score=309.97 TRINITY_DN7306_c0_g1_i10:131-4315(-)
MRSQHFWSEQASHSYSQSPDELGDTPKKLLASQSALMATPATEVTMNRHEKSFGQHERTRAPHEWDRFGQDVDYLKYEVSLASERKLPVFDYNLPLIGDVFGKRTRFGSDDVGSGRRTMSKAKTTVKSFKGSRDTLKSGRKPKLVKGKTYSLSKTKSSGFRETNRSEERVSERDRKESGGIRRPTSRENSLSEGKYKTERVGKEPLERGKENAQKAKDRLHDSKARGKTIAKAKTIKPSAAGKKLKKAVTHKTRQSQDEDNLNEFERKTGGSEAKSGIKKGATEVNRESKGGNKAGDKVKTGKSFRKENTRHADEESKGERAKKKESLFGKEDRKKSRKDKDDPKGSKDESRRDKYSKVELEKEHGKDRESRDDRKSKGESIGDRKPRSEREGESEKERKSERERKSKKGSERESEREERDSKRNRESTRDRGSHRERESVQDRGSHTDRELQRDREATRDRESKRDQESKKDWESERDRRSKGDRESEKDRGSVKDRESRRGGEESQSERRRKESQSERERDRKRESERERKRESERDSEFRGENESREREIESNKGGEMNSGKNIGEQTAGKKWTVKSKSKGGEKAGSKGEEAEFEEERAEPRGEFDSRYRGRTEYGRGNDPGIERLEADKGRETEFGNRGRTMSEREPESRKFVTDTNAANRREAEVSRGKESEMQGRREEGAEVGRERTLGNEGRAEHERRKDAELGRKTSQLGEFNRGESPDYADDEIRERGNRKSRAGVPLEYEELNPSHREPATQYSKYHKDPKESLVDYKDRPLHYQNQKSEDYAPFGQERRDLRIEELDKNYAPRADYMQKDISAPRAHYSRDYEAKASSHEKPQGYPRAYDETKGSTRGYAGNYGELPSTVYPDFASERSNNNYRTAPIETYDRREPGRYGPEGTKDDYGRRNISPEGYEREGQVRRDSYARKAPRIEGDYGRERPLDYDRAPNEFLRRTPRAESHGLERRLPTSETYDDQRRYEHPRIFSTGGYLPRADTRTPHERESPIGEYTKSRRQPLASEYDAVATSPETYRDSIPRSSLERALFYEATRPDRYVGVEHGRGGLEGVAGEYKDRDKGGARESYRGEFAAPKEIAGPYKGLPRNDIHALAPSDDYRERLPDRIDYTKRLPEDTYSRPQSLGKAGKERITRPPRDEYERRHTDRAPEGGHARDYVRNEEFDREYGGGKGRDEYGVKRPLEDVVPEDPEKLYDNYLPSEYGRRPMRGRDNEEGVLQDNELEEPYIEHGRGKAYADRDKGVPDTIDEAEELFKDYERAKPKREYERSKTLEKSNNEELEPIEEEGMRRARVRSPKRQGPKTSSIERLASPSRRVTETSWLRDTPEFKELENKVGTRKALQMSKVYDKHCWKCFGKDLLLEPYNFESKGETITK